MLGLGFGVIEDAAIPVAVFELDAGLSASYGGSGQTFAHIVTAPADESAQTAYDFYRGATSGSEGSDPTFNGSAGANSANEYFSFDGGDYLTLAGSNTTFINSLHKENAAFTWYGFLKTGDLTAGSGYFGTISTGGASIIGISIDSNGSGQFILTVNKADGSQALNPVTSGGFLSANTKYMLAVSYDEASGAGLFYRDGASGKGVVAITGAYSSPGTASATYTAQMMALGNAGSPAPSGSRLWRTGMFNRALTEAQLDALFERHKAKLGL
mgnify:CR=1 FL=1